MKALTYIFLFMCCTVSAQHTLPFDTLKLRETKELFADDYGNIYLYRNKDLSVTKYDSLGRQKGRLMFTLPYQIQSVQNPLNIPAFSENAQVLRFYDQNLNVIQAVDFRQKFGYIKVAYAEDQQQVWLLDESTKRLIQYNFREDRVINAFPLNIPYDSVTDLLIFENQVYILTKDSISIYSFKPEKVLELPFSGGKRLRRENDTILIMSQNAVSAFADGRILEKFRISDATIVDKNSAAYFVIRGNKLYLYPVEKGPQ